MTDRPVPPSMGEPTEQLATLESAHLLEAVPGYVLLRLLRESPIARAYQVRHERSGAVVVLKVLTREAASDRSMVQRLLRESRVIAGLRSHPHTARVIDVGEVPAGPYVAFEQIAGTDLRTLLMTRGALSVAEALAAVRDAARALEAACAVGVAHRDVKPSNLFRVDDAVAGQVIVKLTDFAFAAPLALLGGPVGVYGTPAFVAPELLRGAPADIRTDIYALGATLFQLVTARPLFEGSTAEVLAAHQKKPIPSIATLVPDAGIAFVDVIYRLLHKDPARRPQTAAEVTALLDEAMGSNRGPPRATSTATKGGFAPAPSEPQWPTAAWSGEPLPPPTRSPATLHASMSPEPPVSPFDGAIDGADADAAYVAQPTGVLGTLKQMNVTDILQMLELGKKSARLELQVDTPAGPANGLLHVHDGQIVFASLGPLVGAQVMGEDAVVALCHKNQGFFRIHYEKEHTEHNVTKPTQFVLLEAMRRLDEVSHAPIDPADPAPTDAAPTDPTAARRESLQMPPSTWTEPQAPSDRSLEQTASGPRPRGKPFAAHPPSSLLSAESLSVSFHPPPTGDSAFPRSDMGDATYEIGLIDDPTMPEAPTAKAMHNAQMRGAIARGSRVWGQLVDVGLAVLARVHPRLGRAALVALVVMVMVVVVVVGSMLNAHGWDGPQAALDAIMRGKAGQVVRALEAQSPADRSLEQELWLGHAHAALGQDERALELYRVALPGRADVFALAVLAGRLDASAPDDEIDLLVLWPDPDADELLSLLTVDVRARVRANAAAILAERDGLGLIDVEHGALLDFVQAASCGERRVALATLRVAGKSADTLAHVDRLGRAFESCFAGNELRNAYTAIKKRLEP